MASFVNDTRINVILEEMIQEAEDLLVLYCPYFKLHDRLRDKLRLRKDDDRLKVTIVFGKNEDDPSRSLNREDFEFLQSFRNVEIAYEKRLHAKYYANEKRGLITSLNLHTYSQNNNIEVGVEFKTKNLLKKMTSDVLGNVTSIISDTEDLATEASEFFYDIYQNAEKIFVREPRYQKGLLGLTKSYSHSEVIVDRTEWFYEQVKPKEQISARTPIGFTTHRQEKPEPMLERGFCIRTGEKISFNPARPLSRGAYQSWAKYSNPDFGERFCHSCGKKFSTSVRYPLCSACN
ncbi:hypothetical protein EPD60_07060 [Flaviaesturariibacter flavus]|uniref:Phospholipase D-like domain-containing protein n=1 Tax=Flaviaesturariibacter flavus TaxID=2502780 RepID=A0A4R1BIG4_9BACT|nr:phospholipase D family protein [Flaviaesturariibacter flavus]TCJ17063.1 hypothetical protein EPD60_07060 [Flaviaesturariibacter flavus]